MTITQAQFKELKVGDLVEWNNTVTTNANDLGIIMQSHTFQNGNPQTMRFHQIKIKWSKFADTCAYTEFDEQALDLLSLTTGAS